jgi:hypothetical protein
MQDGVDGVMSDAFRRDSNAGSRVGQAFAGLGVNVVIKLLSRRHRRWAIYRQCNSTSLRNYKLNLTEGRYEEVNR